MEMEEHTTMVILNVLFKVENCEQCNVYPSWHIYIIWLYLAALYFSIANHPNGQIVSKNQILMKEHSRFEIFDIFVDLHMVN